MLYPETLVSRLAKTALGFGFPSPWVGLGFSVVSGFRVTGLRKYA